MQTIVYSDCLFYLKTLKENSIDLCITSPPYKKKEFPYLIEDIFLNIYRVLKPDSLFFLNFGHLAEDKLLPFRLAIYLEKIGFNLNETIVWVKNHYTPLRGNKRINNLFEYIFVMHKGNMPELNRLAVGIPYADKSNIGRYSDIDLKCAGNVWYIPYETINNSNQKPHKDRFPMELPERCIKLCGYNIETVLDPFAGSGTTLVACENLNKKGIGIEIDKNNINKMKKRLINYKEIKQAYPRMKIKES